VFIGTYTSKYVLQFLCLQVKCKIYQHDLLMISEVRQQYVVPGDSCTGVELNKVYVNSETLCFCNYHVSPPREATHREESQSTDS
jgi:hypothetical protein